MYDAIYMKCLEKAKLESEGSGPWPFGIVGVTGSGEETEAHCGEDTPTRESPRHTGLPLAVVCRAT